MIQDLCKVLIKLYDEADKPFSGLGLLVCSDANNIPIYPLYRSKARLLGSNIFEQLLELSNPHNTHHDGFHVISPKLEITHIAQYFYPQPIPGMSLDAHNYYGARYFVAQAGSAVHGVLYTAVVGANYGVCIFENGYQVMSFKDD